MKRALLVALLAATGLVSWLALRREPPREVEFTRPIRETLVSTVVTNGKIEPVDFSSVRSPRDGAVLRLAVRQGQNIRKGQVLLEFDASAARREVTAAETRTTEANAEIERLSRGGDPASIAEIETSLERARADASRASQEIEVLERLVARNAATAADLNAARDRLARARLEIQSLDRKRQSLIAPESRTAAEARLRDASHATQLARRLVADATVTAPASGLLYHLAIRPGAVLRAGDLIADIGRVDQLRARIYVDEPELGRVAAGMPAVITWDALPGASWPGTIERMPTQVVTFGTRQVGEVLATFANSGQRLVPGANVNAEIRSRVVENALTIPKEALRREQSGLGVWVLNDGKVAWRPVRIGVSSLTSAEILDGLTAQDAVALVTETPLQDQEPVTPKFR